MHSNFVILASIASMHIAYLQYLHQDRKIKNRIIKSRKYCITSGNPQTYGEKLEATHTVFSLPLYNTNTISQDKRISVRLG